MSSNIIVSPSSTSASTLSTEGGGGGGEVKLKFSPEKEVLFTGSFFRDQYTTITVENPSTSPSPSTSPQTIVFKVMLTDPLRYIVRPNYAILVPGQSIPVKVTLRSLPNEVALEQLLTSRQSLLFKWRTVHSSNEITPSTTESSFQENPNALFIESTSAVYKRKLNFTFKPTMEADDDFTPGPMLITKKSEFESRSSLDVTPSESLLSPSPPAPAHTPTPTSDNDADDNTGASVLITQMLQFLAATSIRMEVLIVASALLALLVAFISFAFVARQ